MSDEVTVKPKVESTLSDSIPQNQPLQNTNQIRVQLATLCALALGFSFFLPWIQILGGTISGFDLQKIGNEQRLLWAIPVFSGITIIAGLTRTRMQFVGQLAGVIPFGVAFYAYCKIGPDLTHILSYGAYLSLISGAVLFVLVRTIK